MNSLRNLVWLAFLVVGTVLALVVLLGAYQHRLSARYTKVMSENETVLFHFITVRENVSEAMLQERPDLLGKVVGDLELLNKEITRLSEQDLISPELRLALVEKMDLPGLAILIKQVVAEPSDRSRLVQVQQRLRQMADYLLQVDRLLVGQARAQLLNFQLVVIGALGLIVCLASLSLILLYRNTVSPMLAISRQLEDGDNTEVELRGQVVAEVSDLAARVNLLLKQAKTAPELEPANARALQKVGEAVNQSANSLNGIINYAQLLQDEGQSLAPEQQHQMLQKIIDSADELAAVWRKVH